MNKTLEELKKEYSEIAGRWNGEDTKGEFEALDAKEIVEAIEELESKIKDYEASYEF